MGKVTSKRQLLLRRPKEERNRIHAMPRVLSREPFAQKYMAEVAAARSTDNFRAPPVSIGDAFHRPGNFVVKTRPAAARIELVFRTIQLRLALPADINAWCKMLVVFTRAGILGTFMQNDARFFFGEGVEFHRTTAGKDNT